MAYEYDFAVFIGRFQPFHAGHLQVIRAGLARAEQLIVLVGSAWQPRNPRNPWSHEERERMVRASLDERENARLHCLPLMDAPYNDEAWVRNVQSTVNGMVTAHYTTPHRPPKIALVGHQKDHTGYYLSLFPGWGSVGVDNHRDISATPIRHRLFTRDPGPLLDSLLETEVLPEGCVRFLSEFARKNQGFEQIREEIAFVERYRSAWVDAPYEPTFVTVDGVVVQSGHVLLVQRRASPGKGLWALPGGFVDPGERLLNACLRELREETRLKVPAPVLKGSIRRQAVYDDPYRSARGRTITHAFYMELEPNAELPRVKGSDDARLARWVPLGELDPRQMFEDHYFIIQDLIGAG